jgi:hypothetical protein
VGRYASRDRCQRAASAACGRAGHIGEAGRGSLNLQVRQVRHPSEAPALGPGTADALGLLGDLLTWAVTVVVAKVMTTVLTTATSAADQETANRQIGSYERVSARDKLISAGAHVATGRALAVPGRS